MRYFNELLIEIGKEIRAIRISKNMTIYDLEHKSGVSNKQISFIERGLSPFDFETLVNLLVGLEISLQQIVTPENTYIFQKMIKYKKELTDKETNN
ncbi:helix-turn-helix transcriptional regulator [Pullulanibacillus sp. KACC 23026]|uniref:helix-turn-helix domain-containing protein n=1 Tax=Pullulanibacillus sp. KACC 23026 TaxID=3028315 RepID=UPI0023B15765|nr:helix-turn-helix transcriptional regulator [Pullulanibacillus sp. KACC 23026]WEG13412.1 helix-turn-helix transcriptional regulator [Pullulanibacillus sp. KACC 23026]